MEHVLIMVPDSVCRSAIRGTKIKRGYSGDFLCKMMRREGTGWMQPSGRSDDLDWIGKRSKFSCLIATGFCRQLLSFASYVDSEKFLIWNNRNDTSNSKV